MRILATPEAAKERLRLEKSENRDPFDNENISISGGDGDDITSIAEEAFEGIDESNRQNSMPDDVSALLKSEASTIPPKNLDAAPRETNIPLKEAKENLAITILDKFADDLISEDEVKNALSGVGSILTEKEIEEALKHNAINVNISSILEGILKYRKGPSYAEPPAA